MDEPTRPELKIQGVHRFKPYPKYKDSGVEWLGPIPAQWVIKRVKWITLSHKQGYYTEDAYIDGGVKLARITDIDDFGNVSFENMPFVDISRREESIFGLKDKDFVFARSGTIGRFGLVRQAERSVFASYLICFRFKECFPEFLRFAFSSLFFRESLISTLHGGANQNVHAENIKEQSLAIPTFSEQCAIASFLDRETAKINALVAKKERLIALLHEKRMSLITRAVTKGLNPDVPMKDSGVVWLGEIPAHWKVKRLKYVARLRSGEAITSSTISETGEYPVYGGNGLRGYTSAYTHEGEFPLIGRQGALCGCINYAQGRFWASEHAVVAAPTAGNLPVWLRDLLQSMKLNQYSESAAQPGLAVETIVGLKVPVPPAEDQRAIAAFLDRETAEIESLIAKIREGIEKLKEYRIALISAAVTGKIDVREEGT
jgi:type I restriction enzyme S subunit